MRAVGFPTLTGLAVLVPVCPPANGDTQFFGGLKDCLADGVKLLEIVPVKWVRGEVHGMAKPCLGVFKVVRR